MEILNKKTGTPVGKGSKNAKKTSKALVFGWGVPFITVSSW